jgi:hypothetical protein
MNASQDIINYKQINDQTFSIQYNGQEISQLHINNFETANRPYLFPVKTPSGIGVTRHYPMEKVEGETNDHIHHTGVWTAWGDVNGVDNWAAGPKKGRQIVKAVKPTIISNGLQFVLDIDWVTPDGKPQLAETRTIVVYNPSAMPSSAEGTAAFVFDFIVEFHTKYGSVKFGDTKEGGLLSVRVATPLDVPRGGMILNAKVAKSIDKSGENLVWGKRAKWCDYSGQLEGKPVGVAIIDHPLNPVSPTYWHVRNYGLMTANPFGKSHFEKSFFKKGTKKMKANATSVWKYRMVVHDGSVEQINLENFCSDFNPQ